ncbi:hypothetical protein [Alienimonas chondri]|uniref:Uncharacterized protein n=1 Tax=Alienimonas chondri TaxID=2681879 RepID=A0ABX1VG71_9PLAN|nr:hypothetical protein [Alienimonas chondri]NNJ27117.1 hypothetical protein [Alienimonas chondri]
MADPPPADAEQIAPPAERRSVWPGGPALWLWAAPVIGTCGNFGLLLVLSFHESPFLGRELDQFLGRLHTALGGGLLGDAAIMAGITLPASLPGFAYTLRRDGTSGRGWRNASLYGMIAWAACTVGGVALLNVVRHWPL